MDADVGGGDGGAGGRDTVGGGGAVKGGGGADLVGLLVLLHTSLNAMTWHRDFGVLNRC